MLRFGGWHRSHWRVRNAPPHDTDVSWRHRCSFPILHTLDRRARAHTTIANPQNSGPIRTFSLPPPTPPALSTSAIRSPQRAAAVSPPCAHTRNAAYRVDVATPPRHSFPLRHSTTSSSSTCPFPSSLFSVLRSLFSSLHSATRPLATVPLLTFQPDAATSDAILQSIAADYSLSLTDIAAKHNTTIEALTAWLTRDDIDERLTAIESACARRARLTAANHLPAVAHVAKQALEEASDVLRLPPTTAPSVPSRSASAPPNPRAKPPRSCSASPTSPPAPAASATTPRRPLRARLRPRHRSQSLRPRTRTRRGCPPQPPTATLPHQKPCCSPRWLPSLPPRYRPPRWCLHLSQRVRHPRQSPPRSPRRSHRTRSTCHPAPRSSQAIAPYPPRSLTNSARNKN